jgi:hypothetical protein
MMLMARRSQCVRGSKTRTLKKRDWNRIQTAEIKSLRTVTCTKTNQLRNDIRNELGILQLYEENREYGGTCKIHLQRTEQTRIPLQAYSVVLQY